MTDCNVVLGKLQPDQFPALFGPNGDQPLDVAAARAKFDELADQIAAETGEKKISTEALAESFLRIAVENMANAIKKISVQRGYDVTKYTMNCFGGAGGQHACQVADVLGMENTYIHPFAGVLSAFGMGLADIRAIREHQFAAPLSNHAEARDVLDRIGREARREILGQGIANAQVNVVETAHIRTRGSHQTLPVPFGSEADMRASFDAAHRQRFGFVPDYNRLIIDLLTAEAVGTTGEGVAQALPEGNSAKTGTARMFTQGDWRDVPLVQRGAMRTGDGVDGPAIIVEPTSTNAVEPGWPAQALSCGGLVLRRVVALNRQEAIGTSVDLVANAPHVPVHLGSMSDSVRTILRQNAGKIRPGDVFMMNNPYNGGTHLPDVTVITPVFDADGKKIIFLTTSRGHHADIGGGPRGSPPRLAHIDEEGVLIDNFLLVNQGTLRESQTRALLASGRYSWRNIDENRADLAAQIAANSTGAAELTRIVGQFGLEVVQAYMGHVQDNAGESVRRVLDVLKDCAFTYPLDSGAQIKVQISVDKVARTALVAFTGTSPQDQFNHNAPFSICRAVILYFFRTLMGADIPMSKGCLKPIEIRAPKGPMINPEYPAAVISGNTEVSQAIADTLYGALGVIAGSQGTMNNFVYGNARIQNYETICGGTGAGEGFDGASAVHSHMTSTRMTDPEVLETRFPVRVEQFSIRKGSGGRGNWSSGNGITRWLRFLEEMTATVLSSHRQVAPHDAVGGQPGQCGENHVQRADGSIVRLKANDEALMALGDIFVMNTPGGSGFGTGETK